MTILHSTDFFKAGISTVAIEPRLPQSAFPEHHHDFHEIVIVEQGTGIHVFNGQPYTIGGGSVCFIRDHDRHLYEHTDNLCLTNVLYRAPDAFRFLAGVSQLLPQEQEGNYPSHWRVNQTVLQQVRHIVAQIEAVGSDTDTHAVASREILFMQLLVLLRKSSLAEEATNNDARLNQLLAWLEDHFAQEICWEEVAAQFSLSLRTLHRQLKQQTGLTPQRYLNRVRLMKARHLLRLNTGMDLELCIASRMLELNDLLERLETSLCLTIALKSFISICNYASVYNRPKVLRKCYTWLKRYACIVHCHSEMVAR